MAGQDYREAIADYVAREAKPEEKFGHQPRLYALCVAIGEGLTYDDDVLYAAAWLHDMGVFLGHRPESLEELKNWDNTAYAVEKTPQLLNDFGFPAEKSPAVVEAIRTHQPHRQPTNLEGRILRDADILEQLGAVGVLRTVCKVGRDTRFARFTDAKRSLERALAELPKQLQLPSAKKMAEPRIVALQGFLAAVASEAGSNLY